MPVESVTEDYQGSQFSVASTTMAAQRIFDVTFDAVHSPLMMPSDARLAVGIPAIFDEYPANSDLICINKTVTNGTGPKHWIVTCQYGTPSATGASPLGQPAEIGWSFAISTEEVDRDIYDNPIVNSSGESFDPPITKDFHDLVLTVIKNQSDFAQIEAAATIGKLNNDYFYGFSPGKVKCTRYEGRQILSGSGDYYQVTYEFQIRDDGWQRRILDQGFRDVDGDQFKDSTGTVKSEPTKLDGAGNESSAAYFLAYDLYASQNFSGLNLT